MRISEIEEEKRSYLIISQNDGIYNLSKDTINPKYIADIRIYLILQINSKNYIILNDTITYIYEGFITKQIMENSPLYSILFQ